MGKREKSDGGNTPLGQDTPRRPSKHLGRQPWNYYAVTKDDSSGDLWSGLRKDELRLYQGTAMALPREKDMKVIPTSKDWAAKEAADSIAAFTRASAEALKFWGLKKDPKYSFIVKGLRWPTP